MVLVIHHSYYPGGRPVFNGRPAEEINSDPDSDIQIIRDFQKLGYTDVFEPEVDIQSVPIQKYIELLEQNS